MTTQTQPVQPVNPFQPPSPSTSAPLGHEGVQMPAVHPDTAKQIINSRPVPTIWQPPTVRSLAQNTTQGAASIVEMARALKNDPSLMFEFVHNNIEHDVGMGLAKGPLGTLLDGCGNSFDLCSLLAALLRQANFEANYEVGQIQITLAQAVAWLGITDNNIATASTVLANAGVPVSIVGTAPNEELLLAHCWLKVNIGTVAIPNWVVMDPSFKTYTTKTAINLATATGYSAATFLSNARAGYSIDPSGNWVQNLNRNNVRNNLSTLSMNLANWIRTNNPGATTDDIVGGRQIVPVTLPITFPATLAYQAIGDVPVEFTGDFSTAYKTSVRLVYFGFDVTLTSDQLCGHRLTLFFVPSGFNWIPTLALDGVTVATGTTVGQFFEYYLQVTVTHHAYPNTNSDQTFFQFTQGPKIAGVQVYYLLGSSFGPAGKGSFDHHTALQYQNEFNAGGAGEFAVSEPALGERLAAHWASYSAQLSRVADLINRMTGTTYKNHHIVCLISYRIEAGGLSFSGIDIQSEIGSWSNLNSANTNLAAAGILRGMHLYAAEMLAIQQQTAITSIGNTNLAVSTTRLMDTAASQGAKIFKGTAANWTSDVVPALTNYNAGDLNNLYTNYLAVGENVLLPQNNGYLFNGGHWSLKGWSIIRPQGGAGGLIFGVWAGGLGRGWWPAEPKKKECEDEDDDVSTGSGGLNLSPGGGLTVGSGEFPYSLPMSPSYDSRLKLENGPLGMGWSHNWDTRAQVSNQGARYSDGFLGLGSESPIGAVASITQIFVNLDILSDTTLPVDKLTIAHLSDQWWVDQMTSNIVTVQMVAEDMVFSVLPDGSFQSSRSNGSILTQPGGFGSYILTTPQKIAYTFDINTDYKLSTIAYPSGVVVTLTYDTGKLMTVDNGMGRTLTFNYTGNVLSSVSDGTGLSVSYTVDGANQLTQVTDALAQNYTFEYDSPGRLQKYFKPKNPTDASFTATFDSLGRVQSKTDILGHTKNFFFAGSRSEIVDPVGNSSIKYFDGAGNTVKSIDALGNVRLREFDGLGRIVKETMPEGNFTTLQYDLNNNVLTGTIVAKPGSALANIVRTNTYDPLWNKVSVATDGRGNSTVFTYDPATGNLLKIERPIVGGQIPTVTMTWNARGQMLTTADETGIVRSMVYDTATEKLLSVVADSGASPHLNLTTNLGYDAVGNVTSVQDPLGRTTTFQFDVLRRMTRRTETAPFNHQTRFAYDENGNMTSVRRQTGIVATPWQIYTFGYSLSDKKTRITDPAGNITRWFYDGADRLRRVRDAENREYVYGYDVLNRVRTVTDPSGVVSETRLYTDNGKLRSMKDARGNITTFTFEGFDRPNRTNYPDGTFERNQSYDENGNLLNFRTRSGSTVIRTYDVLNRILTRRPQSQPTVSYSYDLAGRLLSARKPIVAGDPSSGIFQQQWDSAGRFFKEIYPDSKSVTFELDANSNVTKVIYPDGYYVERGHDQLNRLSTIKLNGNTANAVSFSYDPLSRRTSMAFSSGGSVAYDWQLNDDLTSLTNNFVGSNLALAYGFNAVHQITSQNFSDNQYSWHPGAAGSLAYDPANSTNQYPQVGGTPFSYNGNGCLTSDGVWTHGYDTENHLLSSAKAGTSLAFVYDPFHRQAEKSATTSGTTKTRYIYSGWQRIADYDSVSGALQNRYVYGTGLDEPLLQVSNTGVLTFLHANQQGSILAVTDNAGSVSNRNAYGPFGESTPTGTTFGYTGQRYDSESGLYLYKRRYYDPANGRFLQTDPIGYQIEAACGCSCAGGCGADSIPSQLNLYSYVVNDPINLTDPLGFEGGSGTSTLLRPNPLTSPLRTPIEALPTRLGSAGRFGMSGLAILAVLSVAEMAEALRRMMSVKASEKCFEEYDDRVKKCEKACKDTIRKIKEAAMEGQRTGKAGVVQAMVNAVKEAKKEEEDCKKNAEMGLLVCLVEKAKDPVIIQWLLDQ